MTFGCVIGKNNLAQKWAACKELQHLHFLIWCLTNTGGERRCLMLRLSSLLKCQCIWLLSLIGWYIFLFFESLTSWEWSLIKDLFVKLVFMCTNLAVSNWWELLICADSCQNWCEHWMLMFSSVELSIRRTYTFENYTEKHVIQISFFMQILIQSKKIYIWPPHIAKYMNFLWII